MGCASLAVHGPVVWIGRIATKRHERVLNYELANPAFWSNFRRQMRLLNVTFWAGSRSQPAASIAMF